MLRTLLTALLLFPSLASLAATDTHYSDELIENARALDLGYHPEWLKLGHYLPAKNDNGYVSLADSRNFFNARNGKHAPRQELEATIRAFFSPPQQNETLQHPQCQFIARYQWLKRQLHIDPRRLAEQECPRFDQWYQAINPDQITLIFPAAYMNNPSSMFGHTLLRIDMPEQSERTRLISYAINFAAQTDETNGVIFAIKGLSGGYPGGFSIMPYYEKVKEYNNLENRDIWEYQLNFNREEIRRLLEHIWELGQVRFDYYFFDENCSYQLLAVLDVARPGLELAERFPAWAIPSDTLRVVTEQQGLLKKVVFRPSGASRLQHRLTQLNAEEQVLAHQLATGAIATDAKQLAQLAEGRRVQVLEIGYDYLQYLFNSSALPRDTVSGRSLKLLKARSRITSPSGDSPLVEPHIRPDQGHRSNRLAMGLGRQWEQDYLELKLRPAYHDLLDPADGYTRGAQINFFNFSLRRPLDGSQALKLEKFTLLDIVSVAPRNRFFSPRSWKIATGWRRVAPQLNTEQPLAFYLDGGVGPSYPLTNNTLLTLFVEATADAAEQLEENYSAAAGASASLRWHAGQVNAGLTARRHDYLQPDTLRWAEYRLDLGITLTPQSSLRASAALAGDIDNLDEQYQLGLHWYF